MKLEMTATRNFFNAGQADLERICMGCIDSFESCPGAEGSLDDMGDALDTLYDLTLNLDEPLDRILQMTHCKTLNGIYVDIINNGVCTELPKALHTVFSTLIFISTLGLIFLVFTNGLYLTGRRTYAELGALESPAREINQKDMDMTFFGKAIP